MWLQEIEADRLRNLKAVSLSLPAGLSVVTGRNAQGKTSLLEAIYLLATGRSFRTRKLEELIARNGGPLRVAGEFSGRIGRSKLAVFLDEGSRRLLADEIEKDPASYIGRLDIVDLTAERMNVVRGAPLERRRFLDRGVVGLRPDYLREIGEYRRVLAQRNALLRRGGQARPEELDVWDERLRLAAVALHGARRQYAVLLGTRLGEVTRAVLPDGQELRLIYRPSPAESEAAAPDRFGEVFDAALARGRRRDLEVGHTCLGPHRDDLVVELQGVDLRRYGSAGQVRAAMIALKLGKLSMLREERGESPLFLMDDFDTDLDEVRASALAGFLKDGGFQALVATSKEALLRELGVAFMKLRMDDGVARAA